MNAAAGTQSSLTRAHRDYVLAIADDALIQAQRLGWWISRAPELEEDVALANIALDQLGQARALLTHAATLSVECDPAMRTEDDLAYFRDERDFLNVHLVERPQHDFAVAMVRMLILSAWQYELYRALCASSDSALAAIAAKAVKEVDYHLDHAAHWVIRLGDGTDESRERTIAALAAEWPYADELFDDAWASPDLVASGVAVLPSSLREHVVSQVVDVLHQAGLMLPERPAAVTGGRSGLHSESMGYLLAEMQHIARSHPGATW